MSVDVTPARGVSAAQFDFDEVVRETSALVRAVAFRVLRDDADVDDAVQDAFVRAHASIGTLRDARALPAWIARIAHRAAVDVLRARLRARRVDDACALDAGDDPRAPSPEDALVAGDACAHVRVVLAALPAETRRVVELRAQGFSAPEVAGALAIPVGTVESRWHRAKARIVSECFDRGGPLKRGPASG